MCQDISQKYVVSSTWVKLKQLFFFNINFKQMNFIAGLHLIIADN